MSVLPISRPKCHSACTCAAAGRICRDARRNQPLREQPPEEALRKKRCEQPGELSRSGEAGAVAADMPHLGRQQRHVAAALDAAIRPCVEERLPATGPVNGFEQAVAGGAGLPENQHLAAQLRQQARRAGLTLARKLLQIGRRQRPLCRRGAQDELMADGGFYRRFVNRP
ncbi:MAG TPA: hypothetical protein VIN58_12645 [Roseateles sp.]